MNKAELVAAIADRANCTKKAAEEVLTAATDTIIATVAEGDKVQLMGFGTFEPSQRQERQGRNPRTGEAMTIPAATVPKFIPGSKFKETVGNGKT